MVICLSLFLVCCKEEIFHSQYALKLPEVPENWASLLGEPYWRVEWLNPDGKKRYKDFSSADNIEIEVPQTWTNPVTAWPFWPGKDIGPGLFMPAGALFPYDVNDSRIKLTWKAGVDSVLYWELALVDRKNLTVPKVPRLPCYFNWPRFRELFNIDGIKEEVRNDPWTANWRTIAEKIAASGFDRRRLVPESVKEISIPVPSGYWYSSSPFASPLYFNSGQTPVFPARPSTKIWVCAKGILRCNQEAWVFIPW